MSEITASFAMGAEPDPGKRCPHCGSPDVWKTSMRWPHGHAVAFWTCDGCRRSFDEEPAATAEVTA